MEILAKRMRILRKERHLRQEVVAEALGVSISAYRRYELKEREPNAPTIAAMADYFGVSADYLLGRTDEPQTASRGLADLPGGAEGEPPAPSESLEEFVRRIAEQVYREQRFEGDS